MTSRTEEITRFLVSLRSSQAAKIEQQAHAKECSERWGSGHEQKECNHSSHNRCSYTVIGTEEELTSLIEILESHPDCDFSMVDAVEGKIFARRLRQERKSRCLTQEQLGELCGLNGSAIGHFESGRRRPSFANLMKIAKAFGVSVDQLTGSLSND